MIGRGLLKAFGCLVQEERTHRWRLEEQAAWSWDDMMKRMGDLEAREAAGGGAKDQEEEEESTEAQAFGWCT
ncbi:hypothetical protein PR003_g22318 [Phytophthora rubi]|uniref:Uncharacterized protein n=2 Tax=Phytophthora rubi TaxID=129364 RepID=A0A6A4D949_9STRA|nr:hypothetical protein PR003_g22318 [Phytophthora rubi]